MSAPRQVVEGQLIHASAYSSLNTVNTDPANTRVAFKAHLPSKWEVAHGRVDDSKIEKDLYNKVQENLRPLLEKPQINVNDFITHLHALVEISSSRESLLIHYSTYDNVIPF